MVNIIERLKVLFPDITIGPFLSEADCVITDGKISEWGRQEPQPTIAELEAVSATDIAAILFIETTGQFTAGVQKHLDYTAQSWGYDNIISLCTYAGNSSPKYSAEGEAGKTWRSDVWEYCETELEKIGLGTRLAPESVEAFILELPTITRPIV